MQRLKTPLTRQRSPLRWPAVPLLLLGLPPAIAIAIACGGAKGPATPTPAGTPTPSPTVTSGRLPPGFPDDFPLYPNGRIVGGSQQGARLLATMNTSDPRADVVNFYREALNQNPWHLAGVEDVESENASFVNFTRLDNLAISGTVTIQRLVTDGQATQITVVLPLLAGSPLPGTSLTPSPTATEER